MNKPTLACLLIRVLMPSIAGLVISTFGQLTISRAAELQVASFSVDASPQIGAMMSYDPVTEIQMPLTCKGIVLHDGSSPIVLCAIDWLGLANDGMDYFRDRLAKAAGTSRERVIIHTLHQHDAPNCDFLVESMLRDLDAPQIPFDGPSARTTIDSAAVAVEAALKDLQKVTHIGTSKAQVHRVASNRRVMGPDGKVLHIRWSASRDPEVSAFPEGVIDPDVRMVSFWNDEKPIIAMTFYATHPQSYYRTGKANPDFPGMARNQTEALIGIPLIHFNGAGGNITAGKYNDGKPDKRQLLADRLAGGMLRAWQSTKKVAVGSESVELKTEAVLLPPGESIVPKELNGDYEAAKSKLQAMLHNSLDTPYRYAIANHLVFLQRYINKQPIDVSMLRIGNACILSLPGELFIEYQLAAQKLRPDAFVCMAAYGEYSPFYIGTSIAYSQGGYETTDTATAVGATAEPILMNAIAKLLDVSEEKIEPLGVPFQRAEPTIRIGIIGCDTSHVPAFTEAFNLPTAEGDVAGFRVVAAYPGGSPDIPSSIDRVPLYSEQLQKMGVEIVSSVDELLDKVDVVLLESLDGRKHLDQASAVIAAGKRMFIDKPVAGSLEDAIAIYRLAEQQSVPIFSSSSLRFSPGIAGMNSDPRVGNIVGCNAYGPCHLEPHHPDLYWYGVHGVEVLYTVMGPGCESVTRTTTPDTDVVVGIWKDGRVGTFRGIRGSVASGYGATVFGDKGIAPSGGYGGYEPLVKAIAKFFKTGDAPVSAEETIEMFTFMQAADDSKNSNGLSIRLADTRQRAEATLEAKPRDAVSITPTTPGKTSAEVAIQQSSESLRDIAAYRSPKYRDRVDLGYYVDTSGNEQPITDAAHWEVRRKHILARLQEAMGNVPGDEKRVPLDVTVLESKTKDGIQWDKIEYTTEPGDRLRAWLLQPVDRAASPVAVRGTAVEVKLPAVLCLHQTNNVGKDEPVGLGGLPDLKYAIELTERGFVTLTPDYPSFGEHAFDFYDAKYQWNSGSMKAIWDNIRAVDYLQSLPYVDSEKIGCIGHSLGGHNTIFTSVIDQRIKAMVSCCGYTRHHRYFNGSLIGWTSDRYVPSIKYRYHSNPDEVPFDMPELIASLSPRAFMTVAPVGDSNFDVQGVRESIAQAARVYELHGVPDKLISEYPDAEHTFPKASREAAYAFLKQNLLK